MSGWVAASSKVRSGGTPEPAGETPTLPERARRAINRPPAHKRFRCRVRSAAVDAKAQNVFAAQILHVYFAVCIRQECAVIHNREISLFPDIERADLLAFPKRLRRA